MHTPVLLPEAIGSLQVTHGGRYIDATGGEGGYTEEICKQGGTVLALDADERQYNKLTKRFHGIKNIVVVRSNFAHILEISKENNFLPVQGVVFDLGLSYTHYTESGKGFSYKNTPEPLDMRLENGELTASEILNNTDEQELVRILEKNGEILRAQEMARNICRARKKEPFQTVGQLLEIVKPHEAAQVFQALRIEVNNELVNLQNALAGAAKVIDNGRIVIVSFHSLEERIAKQFALHNGLKTYTIPIRHAKKSFEKSARVRIIEIGK